jgi:hypothetical protein
MLENFVAALSGNRTENSPNKELLCDQSLASATTLLGPITDDYSRPMAYSAYSAFSAPLFTGRPRFPAYEKAGEVGEVPVASENAMEGQACFGSFEDDWARKPGLSCHSVNVRAMLCDCTKSNRMRHLQAWSHVL